MKAIIWSVGGVLAALWTGALALVLATVEWAAGLLQQSSSVAVPTQPIPAWLGGWIDPSMGSGLHQAAQQALQGFQAMLPMLGTAAGWLEQLVWFCWGLGMIALLVMAAGSHWLVGRRGGTASAAA